MEGAISVDGCSSLHLSGFIRGSFCLARSECANVILCSSDFPNLVCIHSPAGITNLPHSFLISALFSPTSYTFLSLSLFFSLSHSLCTYISLYPSASLPLFLLSHVSFTPVIARTEFETRNSPPPPPPPPPLF